jgi:hypothetical protein
VPPPPPPPAEAAPAPAPAPAPREGAELESPQETPQLNRPARSYHRLPKRTAYADPYRIRDNR